MQRGIHRGPDRVNISIGSQFFILGFENFIGSGLFQVLVVIRSTIPRPVPSQISLHNNWIKSVEHLPKKEKKVVESASSWVT
jgi:hypothetical protein